MKITRAIPVVRKVGGRVSVALMQQRLARQAAMESQLARYLFGECGHSSTLETQQRYGFCRPKRGLMFCEQCDKWLPIRKPPAPPATPEEPMF